MGSRAATVEPVPSPSVIPLSTSAAAVAAAVRFSSLEVASDAR
jgi:hypothetical protein